MNRDTIQSFEDLLDLRYHLDSLDRAIVVAAFREAIANRDRKREREKYFVGAKVIKFPTSHSTKTAPRRCSPAAL